MMLYDFYNMLLSKAALTFVISQDTNHRTVMQTPQIMKIVVIVPLSSKRPYVRSDNNMCGEIDRRTDWQIDTQREVQTDRQRDGQKNLT